MRHRSKGVFVTVEGAVQLAGAQIRLYPDWLPDATVMLETLLTELDWQQESIVMFGRSIPEPRLVAWYGDEGAVYRYSGRTNRPQPWTPTLADLRDRVAQRTGSEFNSVLANLYRDGSDHMGWHSDDEPELGPEPTIASLSLGATRRFQFRPRPRGPIATTLELKNGSLLVMAGKTQTAYHHRIAPTQQPTGPRINLTFRNVYPAVG